MLRSQGQQIREDGVGRTRTKHGEATFRFFAPHTHGTYIYIYIYSYTPSRINTHIYTNTQMVNTEDTIWSGHCCAPPQAKVWPDSE